MKKTKTTVKVIQAKDQEKVPAEVIAQSIKTIAESVEHMNRSGLSERAIKLLLRDASGESATSVNNVLFALRNMKQLYLDR